MKAMILAAGKGTRLGKITKDIPKALVDIDGRSALEIAVEKCTNSGFDDLIVNIHHHPHLLEKAVGELVKKGYRLTISDESDCLLDTGGGLYNARHFFGIEPFLLYNVDIISDTDLEDFYSYHLKHDAIATLAVRKRPGNRFFLVDSENRLKGWRNKSTGEEIFASTDKMNLSEEGFSGLHIISPEIFRYMKAGVYSMTSFYLELAKTRTILTYPDDNGFWGDIGTPESLELVRNRIKSA